MFTYLLTLLTAVRGRLEETGATDPERGSLTLEQAVITAVLVVAAIALGALIAAAITSHSSAIQ